MKTVWKYDLPIKDLVTIRLPRRAIVLHVGEQHYFLRLWALVDPKEETEEVTFRILGTGHEIDANLGDYCGTAIMHHGILVWHVFKISP